MRSIVTCLLFSLTLALPAAAQSGMSTVVREQAQRMAAALISGDYKTFAHYTNTAVKKLAGGEAEMAQAMEKIVGQMKAQGMTFAKVTIGDPSPILKSGTELQCAVPQAAEIKMPGGRALAKSMLIAVSTDGGKTWTFIDTANKDIAAVRKLLPNLNPNIVIPPPQQPERLPD